MNKDIFFINIHVNLNWMEKLDKVFYKNHYSYRRVLLNKNNKPEVVAKALNSLNLSYEKIHDCSNESKNELGEYDFPKVSYKRRVTEGEKKETIIYACTANSDTSKKIPLQDVFDFVPMFLDGEIKSFPSKTNDIDRVTIEMKLADVIASYKKYLPVMKPYCNVRTCTEMVSSLCNYPADSIVEFDFNSLMPKLEIEAYIKCFKDVVEEDIEATKAI